MNNLRSSTCSRSTTNALLEDNSLDMALWKVKDELLGELATRKLSFAANWMNSRLLVEVTPPQRL